ncbi:hypothetical protein HPP92_018572 [Vanilla planifolia]|uniref:Zn-cluster domain-containing protein n=1 Tax=Vanilla planifolia TaxID=51239 RepID=A0A835QFV1_VANPL|nr:hypothetical protein HPP92_018572 [Vanilla planifolia]
MVVDLISHRKMEDKMSIQEAVTAGIRSMESLILQHNSYGLKFNSSEQSSETPATVDFREIADRTVSKFKYVSSILNRSGHARFRRGPADWSPPTAGTTPTPAMSATIAPLQSLTRDFTNPSSVTAGTIKNGFSNSTMMSWANSSFVSSITGDGSVYNGRQSVFGPSTVVCFPTPPASIHGKPPIASSHKKNCCSNAHSDNIAGNRIANGGLCHCSKHRKNRVKRAIRVQAISAKIADIPSDEYLWRKNG